MKINISIIGKVAELEILAITGKKQVADISSTILQKETIKLSSLDIKVSPDDTCTLRAVISTAVHNIGQIAEALTDLSETPTPLSYALSYFTQQKEKQGITNKLQLVKEMRALFDMPLKDAKDIADQAQDKVGYSRHQ